MSFVPISLFSHHYISTPVQLNDNRSSLHAKITLFLKHKLNKSLYFDSSSRLH